MNNDPNQPQSSSSGQQPPVQSEQSQEPSWYESQPQWGQQHPPQYQPSPYGQLLYEVSPIPDYRPPQQPQKHSRRGLWITLSIIGGLVALGCIGSSLFVALSVGSFFRSTSQFVTPTSVQSGSGPRGLPLYCPSAVALDSRGNMYINDAAVYQNKLYARLVKLSPAGQLLDEWHPFKVTSTGPFGAVGPTLLAVDKQGNVYVADATDDTVKKLSASGQMLVIWGRSGSAPGQFNLPEGVAVDPQGNIYVSDNSNSRIEKFSSDGKLLAAWGTFGSDPGQFKYPAQIAVDTQSNVYVADQSNSRVEKFSSKGKFLAAWGTQGSTPGQFNFPFGVAVDVQGNIYVADSRNERIVKLSPAGKVLTIWDRSPNVVDSLAVDTQGNLYVIEGPSFSGHARIQLEKFSATGKTISVWKGLCTG